MKKIIPNKSKLFFLTITSLLILFLGCENEYAEYDTPEKVAAIFWNAIQKRDAATATAQIYEPIRSEFGKQITSDILTGNIPPLPAKLVFEVQGSGNSVIVVIADSGGVACSLIKSEGRWWVR